MMRCERERESKKDRATVRDISRRTERMLQCVAVCCSVLQCDTVCWCCSVLQCVAICCNVFLGIRIGSSSMLHGKRNRNKRTHGQTGGRSSAPVMQRVAECRSVLQCVAVRCSAWQCVAVCCSVLQCVAVCCSA